MIRKCDIKIGLKFRLRQYNMWMDEDYVRDRDGNVVTFTLTGFFKSGKGRKYAATDFEGTGGHYIAFPLDVFRIKELDPEKCELMAVPVEDEGSV